MEDKHMEDEKEEELEEEETATEDTSPEAEEEEDIDIDYKKELEKVQKPTEQRSEEEKARRALHFNAERAKELGIDPAEVLGIKKPKVVEAPAEDVDSRIDRKLTERDARAMARTDDELQLIMWYVDNKGLSLEEAHLLANKGRIQRQVIEAKRGNVQFAQGGTDGKRVLSNVIPALSVEEQQILQGRGYAFNAKTKSWQGRFYEQYYDTTDKVWKSRKLQK